MTLLNPVNEEERELEARTAMYYANHEAYNREFFPNTVRQKSPHFHTEIQNSLWSGQRQKAIKVFRDGAKTTLLRLFLSKRCAYGVSHTILIISKSEDAACLTINWLKMQIETNTKWTSFYGLRASPIKWTNDDIELIHDKLDMTIRIIAAGASGQVRGTNVNDRRPDLIIVDDADDGTTTATAEQCDKSVKRFFSTFVPCLAPSSETPEAMICVLQTPLEKGDIIDVLSKDPSWSVSEYSCFDKYGQSAWPDRYPTEELRARKASYTAGNLLSVWMKEYEVSIIDSENSFFKSDWLQRFTTLPEKFDKIVIAIDPASSASRRADDNAIVMWGLLGSNCYLMLESAEKGQSHLDTCRILFDEFIPFAKERLGEAKNPTVCVETIGYQKILKIAIENEQRDRKVFFEVVGVQDKRNKLDRIHQAIHTKGVTKRLFVPQRGSEFEGQYVTVGKNFKGHDDVINASAVALDNLGDGVDNDDTIVVGGSTRQFAVQSMRQFLSFR